MGRKLYCECGGLIKAKSKQVVIGYSGFGKYSYSNKKSENIYICSKCGKKHN